jgi:hypothetical protein
MLLQATDWNIYFTYISRERHRATRSVSARIVARRALRSAGSAAGRRPSASSDIRAIAVRKCAAPKLT